MAMKPAGWRIGEESKPFLYQFLYHLSPYVSIRWRKRRNYVFF